MVIGLTAMHNFVDKWILSRHSNLTWHNHNQIRRNKCCNFFVYKSMTRINGKVYLWKKYWNFIYSSKYIISNWTVITLVSYWIGNKDGMNWKVFDNWITIYLVFPFVFECFCRINILWPGPIDWLLQISKEI